MAALTLDEHTRIRHAVRAAESKTSGEIFVVVTGSSGEFRFVPLLWPALLALVVPWPLLFFTTWPTDVILVVQAATFALTATILIHPALRRRLVPSSILDASSRRAALSQFMGHGVHLTENRTGVLIYVAVWDRRVEIVADAQIDQKVEQSAWDELADAVVQAARRGALADGIVHAVERAGSVLAQHFPHRPDDRNELPDHVVEL